MTISLGDRHIEIGRDLLNDICLFNAVASHYRHHAESDLNLLQRYVAVVTQTLAGAPLSDVIGAAGIAGFRDKTIASTIHAIIEPVLDEMQVEQSSSGETVDTPAEIKRLEQACFGQL